MSDKKTKKEDLKEAKVEAKDIVKALGETDWGEDNEAQMKAVQLLKGLALSEEAISNEFMKKLSDASTVIAQNLLKENETQNIEQKRIDEANSFLI